MSIYGKNEATGLTPAQKKQLREVITQLKHSDKGRSDEG